MAQAAAVPNSLMTPQPATFAHSKEDVLKALSFYFGEPVSPEKLRDYNEHHGVWQNRSSQPISHCCVHSVYNRVLSRFSSVRVSTAATYHFPDAYAGSNTRKNHQNRTIVDPTGETHAHFLLTCSLSVLDLQSSVTPSTI